MTAIFLAKIAPPKVATTVGTAIPKEYEEASCALGATKRETIFKVSASAARSEIAAGIVLVVSAIGKTSLGPDGALAR